VRINEEGGILVMRIKKEVRKIVASVLAFLMVVSLIPVNSLMTKANAASKTTFEGGKTVEDGTWKGWTYSAFGNSAKGSASDTGKGGISIEATGGKINNDAKNQGLNTFMYKLDSSVDFTITTQATLNSIEANEQAAFGLMVRDEIGEHGSGDLDTTKNNFAFVGGYGKKKAEGYAGYKTTKVKHKRLGESPAVGGTYDLAIQKVGDNVKLYFDGEVAAECSATDLITDNTMYVGLFAARNANITFNNVKLAYTQNSSSVKVTNFTAPKKTTYCAGNTYEDVDLTGFKATVSVDGKEREITAADCVVDMSSKPFSEVTEAGKLNLLYLGQVIEVPITVIKEVVSDMYIEYMPVKTDYMVTDTALDFTGLVGKVVYNSGRTFDLKTLIDNKNANTTVSDVDFTTAGDKEVTISHTYGDVTKDVIIPINVSDATVKNITITNPNTTRFYTDSKYDENDYVEGLTITADYSDGSSKVIQGTDAVKGYVKAESTELDTTKAGKYVYVVEYNGAKATYELEVVEPTVMSLEVTTYPTTTTYVKGTDFSADGLEVAAVYDSGREDKVDVANVKVDSSAYKKDEAGTYDIKISATVDGKALETIIQVVVRDKKEFKFEDLTWNSIIFGQSISKSKMSIDASKEGSVVIEAKEGAGKCTDDGQDGIAYYYTALDAKKDNFDITANVTVNYFITKKAPDAQEGFGIMVRDSNGTDGDSSIYYSNSIAVGGYYGQVNVFGRYGVTDGDASNRHNITRYGKYNKALTYQIKEDAPKTYELRLKKDNSGIYAWMKDTATGEYVKGADVTSTVTGETNPGGELENIFYYLPADTFSTIDEENMYLGFFAARGAKITVDTSSVVVNVTDRAADAPQTFDKVAATVPAVSQTTLSQTSSESYTYGVSVNTKGLLTIKQNGKTIESQKLVEKGTYTFDTTLIVGDNRFQAYFEPDATQNITSSAPVVMNATVNRRIIAPVKEAIYCSPTGTSSAAGTKEDPLDVQTALTYCQAGQAVYALGGTYNLKKTTGIWHGNDGTGEDGMKYFMAAPDNTEDVVFDFGGSFTDSKFVSNTFDLSGDYWYVSNMKFANGGGVTLGGSHNILEGCDFYGHSNSGLSVSRTDGSNNKADWPSYNQIINCNAYNNSDKSQNNADGFAAKLTCGEGNVFKGCIAAYNADDGWDLFSKGSTGAIGAVEIYDSVCYGNGMLYYNGALHDSKGDGNGFKMGGSGIAVNHKIYNSYSFGNTANGFTNNSDPMGTYVNLVGYNNGGSNLELHVYTGVEPQFTVENVKSYSDDTYKEIVDAEGKALLNKTDKEAKEDVISRYYSLESFFINKNGESVNSEGAKLTAEDFKNLSDFKNIVTGGIDTMPEGKGGKVVLGDFLQLVEDRPEEHVWGEWTVKTAPTCTEKGVEHRLCTKCDAEQTREIDALGHDFSDEFTVDKAPTVLEEGSKSRHCKHEGCAEKVDVTSIAKLTPDTVASGDMKDIVSVVVDTDDIEFTEAEKEAIANGADVKIEVDVKNIADSVTAKDKNAVEGIISGNYVVGSYFDISIILSVGNDKRTITSTDKKIEFTIALPENLINTDSAVTRTYKIVRVHDGETTILDAAFDAASNKLTFKSDKFSTYAIIYSDAKTEGSGEVIDKPSTSEPATGNPETGESTATGDTTNSVVYVILMIMSVMALAGVFFYEKKRKGLSR
jgi:hypothetical protein